MFSVKKILLLVLSITTFNSYGSSLKFGEPYLFEGKFYTGIFDNCCTNGVSSKTTYTYLELNSPLSIKSDFGSSSFKFTKVQISYEKSSSKIMEGTPVKVYCSDLWEGNTGHYALPVYCKDPKITELNKK